MKGFIHLQKLDSWSPQHAITKNGIRIECHISSTSVVLSSTKVVGKSTYAYVEHDVQVSETRVDYPQCTHEVFKTWHVIVSFGDIICIQTQEGEDWAIAHESGLLLIGAERDRESWFLWPKGGESKKYTRRWETAWKNVDVQVFACVFLQASTHKR